MSADTSNQLLISAHPPNISTYHLPAAFTCTLKLNILHFSKHLMK